MYVTDTTQLKAIKPLRLFSYADNAVPAGFPSSAQDYFNGDIDLNEHLITDATSTFIVRVTGESMINAGISHGDELIVDRSLEPKHGTWQWQYSVRS